MKLGNMTVAEFADAVDADFTEEEIAYLEAHRSNRATFTDPNAFHIFKDPAISIHIGDEAASGEVIEVFKRADARRRFGREIGFYPA